MADDLIKVMAIHNTKISNAVRKLEELQHDDDDVEKNHIFADKILIELLNELGLESVTEAFEKIEKWYA